jgi:hypothetical protein
MVTRVATVAFEGIEARAVDVQVQVTPGGVAFLLVGLPDKAVAESRERVRAALIASGLALPAKRITVNLAPADLPKEDNLLPYCRTYARAQPHATSRFLRTMARAYHMRVVAPRSLPPFGVYRTCSARGDRCSLRVAMLREQCAHLICKMNIAVVNEGHHRSHVVNVRGRGDQDWLALNQLQLTHNAI